MHAELIRNSKYSKSP